MKEIGRRSVPLMVPVAEFVSAARDGMRDLADRMGLELMHLAVEEERVAVTESSERVGRKHGSQPGFQNLCTFNSFPTHIQKCVDK